MAVRSPKPKPEIIHRGRAIAQVCGTVAGIGEKLGRVNIELLDIIARCSRAIDLSAHIDGPTKEDLAMLNDIWKLAEDRFIDCHELRRRLEELSRKTRSWK